MDCCLNKMEFFAILVNLKRYFVLFIPEKFALEPLTSQPVQGKGTFSIFNMTAHYLIREY